MQHNFSDLAGALTCDFLMLSLQPKDVYLWPGKTRTLFTPHGNDRKIVSWNLVSLIEMVSS